MRCFVLGSRGQLGTALRSRLEAHPGLEWVGEGGRTDATDASGRVDVTDLAALERALSAAAPDWVLNAAAYTDVDGCERDPQRARRVNAEAPGRLARLCRERGARLLHVSTDYVFDGRSLSPYAEDHPTAPLSVYGSSKLAGEQAALQADPDCLLVRTAWLYGRGRNFVAAVCRRAAQCRDDPSLPGLRVVEDQRGAPTWARDLADGLLGLVERGATGLYHLTNQGVATRWELARAALDHAGFREIPIEPVPTGGFPALAVRPPYSVLDCSRAAARGIRLRPWREALEGYLDSEDSPLAGSG